jgi:hypothetical protein
MSDLEELIKADSENIVNSRKILFGFDPKLPEALDTATGMFKTFSRCMEGVYDDSADLAILKECSKEIGIDEKKLVEMIESKNMNGSAFDRARTAWLSLYARRIRGVIFLLLQRQFMWAATDLLRMRITPAIGYSRLEAESVALLLIIQSDPKVAKRWIKLGTDNEGKAFYKKFQGRIIKELKNHSLFNAYQQGSGASMHVRFVSAVRNLSWKNKLDASEIRLGYQELQANNDFTYFITVLSFLRTQERIFRALSDAFPEVSDPIWFERIQIFARAMDYLYRKLEKIFPNECKKYQQMMTKEI